MRSLFRARVLIVVTGVLAIFVTHGWAIEQRIRIETKTGPLLGSLDSPNGTPPFPVVVIIAGSGPTDRDGNQALMKNNSLKLLGQALASKGIAALRYDKRGIAESAAAALREEDLRFETYVADAVQWINWLRRDPRFFRVGVIGHSEGSLIGILAAKQAKADALVSIAGAGRPAPALIREQLDTKLSQDLKASSDRILDELVAGQTVTDVPKDLMALYRPSVQPYLISWFKYDPAREIVALEIPVLIVQGTTDLQISVGDAKRLGSAKKDATLRIIDGMNHVLKHATLPTEQQAAYTDPSLPIKAQALEEITTFLVTNIATAAKRPNHSLESDAQNSRAAQP